MSAAHSLPDPHQPLIDPKAARQASPGSVQQIAPETAEAFISEKRIGERIKRLRLKRSMGLVELGRHTGLSASFLSQLETGRVVPTLRNLARVAMVFSKDLSYFFEPEPQTLFRVHRRHERMKLPADSGVDDQTYYFEIARLPFVPETSVRCDPYHAEFTPAEGQSDRFARTCTPASEFLYMLHGITLALQHGDADHHARTRRLRLLRRRRHAQLPLLRQRSRPARSSSPCSPATTYRVPPTGNASPPPQTPPD